MPLPFAALAAETDFETQKELVNECLKACPAHPPSGSTHALHITPLAPHIRSPLPVLRQAMVQKDCKKAEVATTLCKADAEKVRGSLEPLPRPPPTYLGRLSAR